MPLKPGESGRPALAAGLARRSVLAGLVTALARPVRATADEALPDIGGEFSLTSHEGKRIGSRELLGRPYALFFGFTSCPDVCPTALFELGLVLKDLGPAAELLTPLFVTVDPERDTQEQLAAYLGAFDPRIVGVRGDAQETLVVMRAFKATARKIPLADGGYTMDHTALIYLMDRRGHFFDKLDYREDHATQLGKFRRLVAAE